MSVALAITIFGLMFIFGAAIAAYEIKTAPVIDEKESSQNKDSKYRFKTNVDRINCDETKKMVKLEAEAVN